MSALLESNTFHDAMITARPLPYRIVLVGFMGAGKSTVGRRLAEGLGWSFIDTDSSVEEKHGMTIAEMFAVDGEAIFRRRESIALAHALGRKNVVIAVGGGAPEILTNRLLLEQTAQTTVVFLEASFSVLFDRCVLQEGAMVRPVLLDAAAAEARFHVRTPFYRRCSQHHLATAGMDADQTAVAVISHLTQ